MPFFDESTMQRIRFLHFKIKHLEDALDKEEENFSIDDLNLVLEYTMILNINYQNQNHKKILSNLDITTSFYDPKEKKDIEVTDLIFECARSLNILARAYAQLSENFEEEEEWDNAIISMVESSKIYKVAAYFSASAVYQKNKGIILDAESLELNSEEARGWAQSIAAIREENNNNLYFASKLYSGLSAISKRIFYLRNHREKKKQQLRAQFHFDMGKACLLKAKASLESSIVSINKEKVKKIQQKANFYLIKAKEIWEGMLKNIKELSNEEIDNIDINIIVVNEILRENDVEELDYIDIKKIQDPEPVIIVPENLAPFVPKSTIYLTKFVPKDLNVKRFNNFKGKKIDIKIPYSKKERMRDKRAGTIRTINELKILKKNNEIDAEKYAELMDKYSTKLQMIETGLKKIK